jgi:MFS family permease
VCGLGRSPSLASGVIAVVAVAYIVGAPLAGRLADRFGIVPVLRVAALTLPQALAFTLAPRGSEGAAAGVQDFSRGLGLVLGPIAVGVAIDAFHSQLGSTHGYAAMWPVIGIPVLASLLFLRTMQPRHEAAYATR